MLVVLIAIADARHSGPSNYPGHMRTALAALAFVVAAGGAQAQGKVVESDGLDSQCCHGHAVSTEVRHADVQFDGHSPRRV